MTTAQMIMVTAEKAAERMTAEKAAERMTVARTAERMVVKVEEKCANGTHSLQVASNHLRTAPPLL